MMLALAIACAAVLFAGAIVTFVRRVVARERARVAAERAALVHEGLVLDGGVVRGVIRLRDYRGPGLRAGRAIMTTRRLVVLTGERLAILGGTPSLRVPRGELRRFAVGVEEGQLRLVTDDPPGATGHIDLRLSVADPETWVTTLRDAGCTLIG